MVSVRAVDISKRFGDFLAVDHVNIEAKDKELITLLGPSGCGKTTTLRIISGLVKPDTGEVYFGEKNVTNVPPHKRNIGFVFQKVALFPHMNVYKNVSFGLKMKKFPKNEIDKRVKEVLKIVRMEGFEERMPSQLSGGQVQRIDIARVLAIDPEVLLFDEPLGHLDAKLRDDLKYEIRRIQKETGKTAIYVTHDQAEAFAISDRVYVMNHGKVQQVGTPIELYLNPKSDFVADFIGTSNFLEGTVTEIFENRLKIRVQDGLILVSEVMPNVQEYKVNDNVIVSIRPEDIELLENIKIKENVFEARVERSTFLGTNTRLSIALGNRIIKVDLYGPERFKMIDSSATTNFHIRRFTIIKKS
ncbi:MAG: ABC transporter ATP-binding protein [Nitrososphaeria archaeon]